MNEKNIFVGSEMNRKLFLQLSVANSSVNTSKLTKYENGSPRKPEAINDPQPFGGWRPCINLEFLAKPLTVRFTWTLEYSQYT